MARTCAEHGIALVHVSSDYVFDGAVGNHPEGCLLYTSRCV